MEQKIFHIPQHFGTFSTHTHTFGYIYAKDIHYLLHAFVYSSRYGLSVSVSYWFFLVMRSAHSSASSFAYFRNCELSHMNVNKWMRTNIKYERAAKSNTRAAEHSQQKLNEERKMPFEHIEKIKAKNESVYTNDTFGVMSQISKQKSLSPLDAHTHTLTCSCVWVKWVCKW